MGFARYVEALFQAVSHISLPPSQIWNDDNDHDDDHDDYVCDSDEEDDIT